MTETPPTVLAKPFDLDTLGKAVSAELQRVRAEPERAAATTVHDTGA